MDYLTGELPASLQRHAVNPCAPAWADAPPPSHTLLSDVWTAVHGGWPLGNTYPALRGGTTEDPSRPDRVLVRGLHPCDAALLTPPPRESPLSDHHGVVATLVADRA
jgi:hypothetical protein